MERTNPVRDTIESWRSRGLRGLLTDLRVRATASVPLGGLHRPSTWSEPPAPVVTTRRRSELWPEQTELWREARTPRPETTARPPVAANDASEIHRPVTTLRTDTAARRRPDTLAMYRARGGGAQLVEIAKFLQVNDAVHGMRGGGLFALPQHGRFAARFSLWKGQSAGTPFLMGC